MEKQINYHNHQEEKNTKTYSHNKLPGDGDPSCTPVGLKYCKSGNVRENLIFANIREFVASRK